MDKDLPKAKTGSFPFSRIRSLVLVAALCILSVTVGYRMGERNPISPDTAFVNGEVVNREAPAQINIDFSMFWDVWQRLHRYWIDAPLIDNQKMVWGAITGMVAALDDPYTTFLPPKENQSFKEDLGGEFDGIGAQLGLKDNLVIIVAPLKGSPAEKAGLKPGDWIAGVNGEDTLDWTVEKAVSKIRGKKGTQVTLSILHENEREPQDYVITRDTITVPGVISWISKPSAIKEISGISGFPFMDRSEKIAYIHLTRFGDRLSEEWSEAVSEITKSENAGNIAGLILDLRNNPGGYLDGSVYIGSEFLKNGTVVSQKNSDGSKEDYGVNRAGKLLTVPLVVLINKGSASASEIVAGALQDYDRATIVGETSFGKGSVQTPQELSGGAGLHITTGLWLTPKGTSISKKGITPDFEIKTADAASADAQLAKAIELLLK